jgi:NodT family efflux transporter outer membrane factor (OMF) lipoprotein
MINTSIKKPTPSRQSLLVLLSATLLTGLIGCTPGPAYVKPTLAVPTSYQEGAASTPPSGWQRAQPTDTADRGAWWEIFADNQLNTLESKVTVSNQTIQKALATLQQAKAMVGVAHAGYFPTLTAGVSQSRSLTSKNLIGHPGLAGKTVSDYSAALDASWEPDLFDRIGHQVDAATAREQASAADLAAISLSMHAELAVDYFNLRQLDAEARLLTETVAAYQQAYDMVQLRFQGGVSSASDLAEAQTQLQQTKAQLIDLGVARAQNEHAIATLIGVPASSFSLPVDGDTPPVPSIPVGLPSTMLQRRPDIAAAERRLAAANADVGEATSAFFPDLLLSASGGVESSKLSQFALLPSRFWALGPALVQTVFDGGRRKQELNNAKATYTGDVADYRQTVLNAFQEVEDNLSALDTLANEAQVQQQAVQSSALALQLANNRYKAGAVDYLTVVVAQSASLSNAQAAAEITRRQLDASVLLVKALGGVWKDPPPLSEPGVAG